MFFNLVQVNSVSSIHNWQIPKATNQLRINVLDLKLRRFTLHLGNNFITMMIACLINHFNQEKSPSQAVAILKDEWRLERNIIQAWACAVMCFSWRRKSIEYFCFFLNLFHYLTKSFDRDYMLREIGVFACLPVTWRSSKLDSTFAVSLLLFAG